MSSKLIAIVALLGLGFAQDVRTVTVPPAIPSNEPSYSDFQDFTSAVLNSTNTYRDQHNASSLSWNSTLEDFAQEYLDDMDDDDCEFEHSGGPYGENLAIGYRNSTAAVEAWGDERDVYDFDDQGFDEETGHFTQLVWKDTTDVGCARKLCDERGWYLVCEYWPRGNVQNQYDQQVEENDEDDEGGSSSIPQARLFTVFLMMGICILLRI